MLLALHLSVINTKSEVAQFSDFFVFYNGAQCFLKGESIYTPIPFNPPENFYNRMSEKAKINSKNCFPNMNSPLHTLFMLPFALLPLYQAFWAWSLISLTFGFLSAGVIASERILLQDKTTSFLWISIAIFAYFPTFANEMLGGQWGLCMLLFVAIIWHMSRRGNYAAAGVALGMATGVKIIFGIYMIYFLVRRKRTLLLWSVATFCGMNIVGLLVFGVSEYTQHFLNLEAVPLFINASWNASSAAFFSRILGGAENIPLVMMPALARTLSITCSIVLVMGIVRFALQDEGDPSRHFDVGFSLATVSMLLISPVGWMYYFPILVIPLFLTWSNAGFLSSPIKYRLFALVAWAVSSVPTEYIPSVLKEMDEPIVWLTSAGYYFYALVAWGALTAMTGFKLRGATASAPLIAVASDPARQGSVG
jgi:hypothetical protein